MAGQLRQSLTGTALESIQELGVIQPCRVYIYIYTVYIFFFLPCLQCFLTLFQHETFFFRLFHYLKMLFQNKFACTSPQTAVSKP